MIRLWYFISIMLIFLNSQSQEVQKVYILRTNMFMELYVVDDLENSIEIS